MTVKLWYLTFKMFTTLLNYTKTTVNFSLKDSLYKLIYKLLSSDQELLGDECCSSLIEFLRKLSESLCDTEHESHLKKKLFNILCQSVESGDGCITRSQGPIDVQVAFVEFLITEDLVKCYDLSVNDQEEHMETNKAYESMIKRYFDSLAKLVQHHIYIYPRLSIKGTASPRSCFSGVLTSLLCGPGGNIGNANVQSYNNFNEKKKTSLFDMSMPNFSMYSNSSQNFNSTQYQAQSIYQSIQSSMNNHGNALANTAVSSSLTTNSIQSVLCNRDMLICLLLKCAVNLITDIRINNTNNKSSDNIKKKKSDHFDLEGSSSKSQAKNLGNLWVILYMINFQQEK